MKVIICDGCKKPMDVIKFSFDDNHECAIAACLECFAFSGKPPWRDDPGFSGHITTAIQSMVQTASEAGIDKKKVFVRWIGLMVSIWKNWQALDAMEPGADRARFVHRQIDDAIAKMLESEPTFVGQISCKAGCHSCCYTAVAITQDEGELLADEVEAKGIEIDMARLKRQWGPAATDQHWHDRKLIKHEDKRCVLLGEDGMCRVYENRPAACRKYMVADKPEFCDIDKYPLHPVKTVVANNAEVYTSAAYNLDKGLNFLPRVLLETMKRRSKARD